MEFYLNRVKHDPPHSYGDCVRACVSSVLETDPDQVPHFFEDGPDGDGFDRLRKWLGTIGKGLIWVAYDGTLPLSDVLKIWGEMNPDVPVIMLCQTTGDHAVIVQGDKVIHNPSWYKTPITGPNSNGHWNFLVIAVK